MFDPNERNPNQEKPKITRPKPTIPSKPKYIPPVNLKVTPKTDSHLLRPSTNGKDAFLEHKIRDNIYVKNIDFGDKCPPETTENVKFIPQHQSFKAPSHDLQVGGSEVRVRIKNGHEISTNVKVSEIEKRFEKFSTVAPNSPSTVCCSILSNSAGDCCGIMGQKKEMTSKSMTKIDSLDSNSSDSGGFKDFIQIESVKRLPDFEAKFERKIEGHQRKFSQPDFLEKSVSERAKSLTQSFSERKSTSESDDCRKPKTEIGRLPKQNLVQTLAPSFTDKTEDISKNFQKPPIINQGQFKQSKKHLEELLAQRLESEKQRQKKINLTAGGDSSKHDFEQQMAVQKQFQQKLQADLNKTVKQIQEIQSTELRLPQNRSWDSNRSQPAIGLKHTPKSRPTIFGTVASDLTPKDGSNRRSLPQTPQTSKNFSTIYNGESGPGNDHIADVEIHQDNALVYRDGNLISGSLEALIQHMVPTDVYYPDRAYLFAFLLSSRLFIKPHELLAKIRQLCETQQGLGSAGTPHSPGTARFAEHLVQLLAEWTETFPYDFRDERVMQHVRSVTQQCMALNQSLRSSIPILLQNLQQRLKTLEAYERSLDQHLALDETQSTDITEVCPNSATLAQQLTHMELERLSFIGPEEFVQAFAKENPHIETSFKDMKKTRNLEQYVQWFNRLSYFVATQVCKHPKKKQRVRVVEFWIETARECFNIGNFNSLMAIIAGLNMSPISRLKKTWNKIQSGKFSILEHQMDPSSNFSSYRSTLKAAMWRSAGATDQRQRIVIPFFSLLVKDLYFLNEGCSNKLPNGHINFEKFWQLAKQVTEFMAWKQVACPFEKETKIINLLQRGVVLNENALALASFECEPPENNQERERCKNLKAENTT